MDKRVLLVLRTPPPFGGGEMIAQALLEGFSGKFDILEFHRFSHTKSRQGRINFSNIAFGVKYVAATVAALLVRRPRIILIDLPKDFLSFFRTSVIILAARALNVKVIGDLPGANFPFIDNGGLRGRYGLWVLRRLHTLRLLSPSIMRPFEERGLRNLVSITNGIASPPLEKEQNEFQLHEPVCLLYVGKIAAAKGIRTIVEFAGLCKQRGWPFHMHLVGEWENTGLKNEISARIEQEELGSYFTFHGLLRGDEKWKVFRKADILVHPTYWDGQPVTILEALASGLPVVATRIGAIPDTIVHGVDGYLMGSNSAEEMLQGVDTIAADQDVYARYALAARDAYQKEYRLDLFLCRMEQLINKVLEQDHNVAH